MYDTFLAVHNLLRWVVLGAALYSLYQAFRGMSTGTALSDSARTAAAAYAHSYSLQFVIGLVLYAVLSPVTQAAFADFGAAMKDSALRYWAVEHIFTMTIGLALAHIGMARARKASPEKQHKTLLVFTALSLLITLSRIPWDRAMLPF